jgi:hypothetical protein
MPPRNKARGRKKQRVIVAKTKSTPQTKDNSQMTVLGKALRTLGGLGGGAIGGLLGMPATGSSIGSGLGASLSKWLGSGDYTVSSNSLVQKAASGVPMMHSTGQSVVIRHKEFVAQISGSQAFAIQQTLTLNPGLQGTFPWLSSIAASYQEYAIKGLVWHYVPTSGSAVNSTNPALGSVMIQTSYRSNDSPPLSKIELMNEFWANEVVPSESMAHPVECDPKENPFNIHYVRGASVPTGDNQLLYDLGVTYVATSGMPANGNVVGDLWVTYEIEFKKPVVASNVTGTGIYAAQFTGGATSNLLGGPIAHSYGNLPLTVNTNTFTIPVGYSGIYYIFCAIQPSGNFSGVVNWWNTPTLVNCVTYPGGWDGVNPLVATVATTTTGFGAVTYNYVIQKLDPSVAATFTFPAPAIASGVVLYVSLNVIQTIP